MKSGIVFASLVLTLGMGVAHAAGDAKAGQTKAATCAACHGMDGNSNGPEWPNLAGQHESYIVKQLKAFKSGQRTNALMAPQAQILSDQDMEDVAAYFAAQKVKGSEADASKVAQGQQIYQGGIASTKVTACLACHGPDGRGNSAAGYPSIHGQRSAYTVLQLQNYKNGSRATDKAQGNMMQIQAGKMTDDQIKAVAAYIQGLR
ncbi:MAG: cytochrome c4 [Steroidobacter sp.]